MRRHASGSFSGIGDNDGVPDAAALSLIPITLVIVLVVSAIAKARVPSATASAVRLLRLPPAINGGWVARWLPGSEIVLAATMLSPWLPLARLASVAALLLFLAYWVIIARAMTFQPRPSCGCFGQIGDQRVTWRTLVRNTLLLAGAGVFVWMTWSQDSTVWSVLAGATGRELAILWSAAYLAVVVWFIVSPPGSGEHWWRRRRAPEQEEVEHSEVGHSDTGADELEYVRVPIPDGFLLDPDRNAVSLHELIMTGPVLLVFVSCGCGSTRLSWERLDAWAHAIPRVQVLGVETRPIGDLGIPGIAPRLFHDPAGKAWEALQIPGTSSAVLLGADGLLAGGPVHGNEEIEQLVDDIAAVLSADAEAV